MSTRAPGLVVTALLMLCIGWIARAPYRPPSRDGGLLRLSWRMRDASAETCRRATQEELDALPVHMRAPEICERTALSYRLIVQVDDAADTVAIAPGGVKGDRPVYVLWERSVVPGPHHVRVQFERVALVEGSASLALAMDTVLDAADGRIELITLANGRLRYAGVD